MWLGKAMAVLDGAGDATGGGGTWGGREGRWPSLPCGRHGAEKAGSRGRYKDRFPEPKPELLGGRSHLSLQGPHPPAHSAPGDTIPALGGCSGFSPLKSTPEPQVPCLRTMELTVTGDSGRVPWHLGTLPGDIDKGGCLPGTTFWVKNALPLVFESRPVPGGGRAWRVHMGDASGCLL